MSQLRGTHVENYCYVSLPCKWFGIKLCHLAYNSINFIESWRNYEMFTFDHCEMLYIHVIQGDPNQCPAASKYTCIELLVYISLFCEWFVIMPYGIYFKRFYLIMKTIRMAAQCCHICKLVTINFEIPPGQNYFRRQKLFYCPGKLFVPCKKLSTSGENCLHRAKTVSRRPKFVPALRKLFPPGEN